MAKPAAPGAHPRTPAEVGSGRRAEAGGPRSGQGGARKAGTAVGRAACLARAHHSVCRTRVTLAPLGAVPGRSWRV